MPLIALGLAFAFIGVGDSSSHAVTWRVSDIPMPFNTPLSKHGGEPHVVVAGSGPTAVVYVSGHAAAGGPGERSPVWMSADNGTRWRQIDSTRQTAGVEGHLVSDGADRAWLFDMTGPATSGTTMPLFGWCQNGSQECFYAPDAYDAAQSLSGPPPCAAQTIVATDRPWVAYMPGKLLLVNNGISDEIGIWDLSTNTKTWNTCPHIEGGFPGAPAIRSSDGLFGVPTKVNTTSGTWLHMYRGTSVSQIARSGAIFKAADQPFEILDCKLPNFPTSTVAESGRFYVTAISGPQKQITVATSTDLQTFAQGTLTFSDYIRDVWITGSRTGDGALLTYSVLRQCAPQFRVDYYARHVTVSGGNVVFGAEYVIKTNVRSACLDYTGSGLGSTGTAYIAIWETIDNGECKARVGESSLDLYVQQNGPRI